MRPVALSTPIVLRTIKSGFDICARAQIEHILETLKFRVRYEFFGKEVCASAAHLSVPFYGVGWGTPYG